MEIIEASPQHFSEIMALVQKVWLPTYTHYVDYQQIILMQSEMYNEASLLLQYDQGHIFYIAVENQKTIGFMSFFIQGSVLKIPKLYVDSSMQQKGVGKKLLQSAEKFAKDKQLNNIELNVNRYNKALYFYRRYGFYILRSVDIPLSKFWLNDYVLRLDL